MSGGGSIRIFPEDVRRVFGVPNNGIVPWHFSLDKSAKTIDAIQSKFGMADGGSSCIAAAKKFLTTACSKKDGFDDKAFRVAFVVYVMGVVSNPIRPTHYENQNFLPALRIIDECSSFDWARCIFDNVIDMCRGVQSDVKKNLTPCPPAGCLLFLIVSVHLFPNIIAVRLNQYSIIKY